MTRQEITDKYFTKWHYDSIPMKSSKDDYIAQVAKLANVANKRAKTLVVADEKGRIPLDRTAYRRYQRSLERFNRYTGYNYKYVSTGKKIYERMDIRQLRALERDLLMYIESDTSTAKDAIEVEKQRHDTIKERYGLDISKLSGQQANMIFNAMYYLQSKGFKQMASDQILVAMVKEKDLNKERNIRELSEALLEMNPNKEAAREMRDAMYGRVVYRSEHIKDKDKPKLIKVKKGKPKPKEY